MAEQPPQIVVKAEQVPFEVPYVRDPISLPRWVNVLAASTLALTLPTACSVPDYNSSKSASPNISSVPGSIPGSPTTFKSVPKPESTSTTTGSVPEARASSRVRNFQWSQHPASMKHHRSPVVTPTQAGPPVVYAVGDSYLARAQEEGGLVAAIEAAGASVDKINADPSRSIQEPGVSLHQSGMAAILADKSYIQKANDVFVELGTNGGDDPSSIEAVTSIIHTDNPKAQVYWVNMGALGYLPASNQAATMQSFNVENKDLLAAAGPDNFKELNWCSIVFGGTLRTCVNSPYAVRTGILDPADDVHPSDPYGLSKFVKLFTIAISKKNTKAVTS